MSPRLSLLFLTKLLILSISSIQEGSTDVAPICGPYEEIRTCGPNCPIACDTLNTNVCCDVTCSYGCFCQDGFILVSNIGPRKCVPFNDCPKPGFLEFRDLTLTVLESAKVIEIVVLRLNGSAGEISVAWQTVSGTAREGTDFVRSSGLLVFPDGVTSQVIRIEIIDDSIREPDEFFTVVLSDPTNNAEISSRIADGIKIFIKDDDMRPGYIEVEDTTITVPENFGTVLVTLVRLQGHDGDISIQYRTVDGTAQGQTDYVPVTGIVTFNEGERRKTIPVTIIDDTIWEPTESFQLQFFNPTVSSDVMNFRQQSSRLSVTITILDDDMRPGYLEVDNINITVQEDVGTILATLNRVGGSDGTINIEYRTVDGTAQAQTDYLPVNGVITFGGGEIRKTIPLTIIDDTIWEPTESFELQFFNPTVPSDVINFRQQSSRLNVVVTIIDNDMKPGYIQIELTTITVFEKIGTINVNLIRVGGTNGQIKIRYRTVDVTAIANSDYVPVTGEVVFNDGEEKKSILVSIIDDDVREPTENFQLLLFDPSAAPDVINFRAESNRLSTTIIILDDDMKPGYIEVELTTITVFEKMGTINVNLIRIGGTDGQIKIRYRTVDVTATANSDYVPVTGEVVFNDGEDKKSILVSIIDDDVREPTENFQLLLFDPSAASDVINFRAESNRSATTIIILDDDMSPGYLELEQVNYTVSEDYGTLQIGIVRIGGTDGILQLKYRTLDSLAVANLDYVSVNGDLIFQEGERRKTIDIVIVNDNIRETIESFQLQIFDLTAGPDTINFRASGTKLTAVITIIDDDAKPGYIELEQVNITVKEDSGTVKVTVVRIGGTDGVLNFKYRTVDVSAIAELDYLPVDGDLVFADGESKKDISIVILNDDIRESQESFQLQIFDITAGPDVTNFRSLGTKLTTLITIIDDDDNAGVFEFQSVRLSVPESIGVLTLTIIRKDGSNGRVSLQLRTMSSTAIQGVDYILPPRSVIFPDGVTERTIRIQIIDDDIREADETFLVGIFNPTNGGILGINKLVTIVIVDNDEPSVIRFPRRIGGFGLDDRFIEIPVVRENRLDRRVSVHWRTEDRSATDGVNYRGTTDSLFEFQPQESQVNLRIRLLKLTDYESSDLFDVVLFDPSEGAVLGVPSRYTVQLLEFRRGGRPSVTVKPPMLPPVSPRISFSEQNIRVKEGVGVVLITISRVGDLLPFEIKIKTIDGTAIAGRDYQKIDSSLSFKRGDSSMTIPLRIIDDKVFESDETFALQLLEPSLSSISLGINVLNITIEDNDEDEPIPRRGTDQSQSQSGVQGSMIKGLPVIAKPPVLPISPRISFSEQNIRVKEGVGVVLVTISRVGDLLPFEIKIKTIDGTAFGGRDYQKIDSSLSFKRGDSSMVIPLRIIDDKVFETDETFSLQLLEPSLSSISLGINVLNITIEDNDEDEPVPRRGSDQSQSQSGLQGSLIKGLPVIAKPPELPISPRISFSEQNIRVKEGVGVVLVTISRVGELLPFEIKIKTIDGTAIAGRDYRKVDGSLSFKRGDSSMIIALRIVDDEVFEPDETFALQLLEPTLSSILLGIDVLNITIEDDDEAEPVPRRGTDQQSSVQDPLTKCPDHLILRECADTCPPTCNSLRGNYPCSTGDCIRGCFCPEGLVKESETSDRCIRPSQCPGGSPVPRRYEQKSRPQGLLSIL